MEQWSAIDEEGIQLATIRVYPNAESATGKKPRIMLVLPPHPDDPTGTGETFEMDMVNDDVENQIVVAERETTPGSGSRARTTILTGRIKHECNLRPLLTAGYMQRVRARSKAANQPRRQARLIDETVARGNLNRLTSGAAQQAPFQLTVRALSCVRETEAEKENVRGLQKGKPKPAKGQFERMARIPRNQLLDELFRLFHEERERWSIKALRERTQQPEAYLKEVLSDVAFLHRSGEFNGTWELMANFKEKGVSDTFSAVVLCVGCNHRVHRSRRKMSQVGSRRRTSRWKARRMTMTKMKTTTTTWRRYHDGHAQTAPLPCPTRIHTRTSHELLLTAPLRYISVSCVFLSPCSLICTSQCYPLDLRVRYLSFIRDASRFEAIPNCQYLIPSESSLKLCRYQVGTTVSAQSR